MEFCKKCRTLLPLSRLRKHVLECELPLSDQEDDDPDKQSRYYITHKLVNALKFFITMFLEQTKGIGKIPVSHGPVKSQSVNLLPTPLVVNLLLNPLMVSLLPASLALQVININLLLNPLMVSLLLAP